MELLDVNKEPCRISFNSEVKNMEFFEIIGNMDLSVYNDPEKRDAILLSIGKELLKNQSILDNEKFAKKSEESRVLTQEEIDALLTAIDPDYYWNTNNATNGAIKNYYATIENNVSYLIKKYNINKFLIKNLSKNHDAIEIKVKFKSLMDFSAKLSKANRVLKRTHNIDFKLQGLMMELTVITGIHINNYSMIERNTFLLSGKNRIDDIPNYKVPKTPEEIKKEVDNYWEYIFGVLFR
jgi:hypothetical protein